MIVLNQQNDSVQSFCSVGYVMKYTYKTCMVKFGFFTQCSIFIELNLFLSLPHNNKKNKNCSIGYCNLFNYATYWCRTAIAYTAILIFKSTLLSWQALSSCIFISPKQLGGLLTERTILNTKWCYLCLISK